MTAYGGCAEEGDHGYLPEEETTTAFTVEINTETLAPEQEEQVNALADSLTGELENKTIKWLSFYDPWHENVFSTKSERSLKRQEILSIAILLHLSQSMAIIKISSEFFYANSSPAVSL